MKFEIVEDGKFYRSEDCTHHKVNRVFVDEKGEKYLVAGGTARNYWAGIKKDTRGTVYLLFYEIQIINGVRPYGWLRVFLGEEDGG